MASAHDNLEKGFVEKEVDSGSDKAKTHHVEKEAVNYNGHVEKEAVNYNGEKAVVGSAGLEARQSRGNFEAPESVRRMTPEERVATELRLRKKLDLRIMPMIVLMYIMNYLDRVSTGLRVREISC